MRIEKIRKLAIVDLSTGHIMVKAIPFGIRKTFLGGRGLNAYLSLYYTNKHEEEV